MCLIYEMGIFFLTKQKNITSDLRGKVSLASSETATLVLPLTAMICTSIFTSGFGVFITPQLSIFFSSSTLQ